MRLSTAVLALTCVLTGYALVSTRASAQDDHSPVRRFPSGISAGTHVMLQFGGGNNINCTIDRVDGGWFRCASEEEPSGLRKPAETWYDIAHVVWVQKVATER